jgi:hypothetical protein
MQFIKKLFYIPTPKELGKSNSNYLPSNLFPNEGREGEYCWEDYDKEMSNKYPIKWFVTRIIPHWWRTHIWGNMMLTPLERIFYWLKSHLTHRYHVLSLRQPGKDGYKYGWIDADKQILYANFNILMNFDKELNYESIHKYGTEEQKNFATDIKNLVYYWTIERRLADALIVELSEKAYIAYSDKNHKQHLYECLRRETEKFAQRETEMLIKLITIRRGMWT